MVARILPGFVGLVNSVIVQVLGTDRSLFNLENDIERFHV